MNDLQRILVLLLLPLSWACSEERPRRPQPPPDLGGDQAEGGATGEGGGSSTKEDCHNATDDDGDALADCDDADCSAICADPCLAPIPLADPGDATASTRGHGLLDGASCAAASPGAAHVFAVTASHSGLLDVFLGAHDPTVNLSLSIRSSCADPSSERVCSEQVTGHEPPGQEQASASVTAGETLFVVVQGYGAGDGGAYTLTARSRVPACGDARIDPGEECDDGNTAEGDGCVGCVFVPVEVEPNDGPEEANPFVAPWLGRISPLRDADFVLVEVPSARYGFAIDVFDLGDGACARAEADSHLELFDGAMQPIASDDDGGDGRCSRLIARDLQPGAHWAVVSASPSAPSDHTFVYNLAIAGDRCGNGSVGGPEECDDGNVANGDGCSEHCTAE